MFDSFESEVQDLCLNKYATTTTRIGCNNIISAANEIELAFQHIWITDMARVFIIDRDNKTNTTGTARIGYNDTVSTASEIELAFREIQITRKIDSSIAVAISNGADIAVIAQENNDRMLVTHKYGPKLISDKNDPLLVADKHVFGAENILS